MDRGVEVSLRPFAVWDSARNCPVVLLFVDDPQVMHVPGPHSKQHQKKDLCGIR